MSSLDIKGGGPRLNSMLLKLSESVDKIPLTRTHWATILLVVAGMFFDILESNSLGLAGPQIIATFGISKAEFALISSMTFIGLTIGAYLGGMLSDIKGRKFALVANLVVYSVGGVLCALAPNYEVLMGSRLIVGIGLGGELAVGIALICEIMPTKYRAQAVAALNVGSGGLGNVVAPAYAALVLVALGNFFGGPQVAWRWLFGLLIVPVLLVLVIRRNMPESPRFLLTRGDIAGANRSLTALAAGRIPDEEIHIKVEDLHDDDGAAVVRPQKIRLGEIFTRGVRRRTATASGAYFMVVAAQMSLLTLMPTFLVARGSTIGQSLLYTLIMQIGSLLGALCAATITYRFRRRTVMVTGAVLGCLVGLGFGLLANTDPLILIFGSLFQFFTLLLTTTLWSWAPELFPTRVRGFGVSFVKGTGGLGIIVMPPLIALIFDKAGLPGVFTTMAIMFAITALLALAGVETKDQTLEEANEARPVFHA